MRRSFCGLWMCAVFVGAFACDDSEGSKGSGTAGAGGGAGEAGAAGEAGTAGSGEDPCGEVDPALADGDADELFAAERVPRFDLVLPAKDWEALKVNARDEEYVEAKACFDGKTIGQVGLRFKGSYGSLYNCFDEAGNNTCKKLGMKVKFNEVEPDTRFFGLKKLAFQSNRYDETYLREKLAYELFRSMGIEAPREAWANVYVNGEAQGLFGMVEVLDGRFTKDRWPDSGDGNLYKEAWPTQADQAWLASKLETNEEIGDVSGLLGFAETMNAASDDELREVLGRYMDLDALARYMAVDDAIANFDGITTFYTDEAGDGAGNHNYFLYEDAPEHFTLIPWDLESTWNRGSGFGNVPRWTLTPEDCGQTYPVWGGQNLVIAPGCDRVFRAMAADLEGYLTAAQELLDGPMSVDSVSDAIETYTEVIRESVAADPNGPGEVAWLSSVQFLRGEVVGLRARLEWLMSGKPFVPMEIDPDVVTDFEKQDNYGLTEGTLLMCNANSTVAVEIDTETPIAGQQSLLMSFEYGNEVTAWEQWNIYRIPLAGGQHDVRELSGIRMKVRSDQPRSLRFDLDSPQSSAASQGIRFGWFVPVTTEATEVEVLFAEAAVPGWAVDQGKDPGDDPADILGTLNGVTFFPECVGRSGAGMLPEGTTDEGFLEVDDIAFF